MDKAGGERPLRRFVKTKLGALGTALVVQLGLLFAAVFVVVLVPKKQEEPTFRSAKTVYLPQRQLEHQAAVAEFQQMAAAPAFMERLSVEALLPDAPVLPSVPSEHFSMAEVDDPIADAADLLSDSGVLGMLSGLNAGASKVSFLGIEDEASRVVIAFDVSASVLRNMSQAGLNMERLRSETAALLDGLSANTLFGLVQFVRAYDPFAESLLPATVGNKERAREWLAERVKASRGSSGSDWVREQPDGVQSVLRACFAMEPDVVFLISDGSFQRTPEGRRGNEQVEWADLLREVADWQDQLPQDARVHVILFGASEEDVKGAQRLAAANRGELRVF